MSSLRPALFNAPATDESTPPAVCAVRPPGTQVCAPAKTRCWIDAGALVRRDRSRALLLRHRDVDAGSDVGGWW